MFHLSKCKFVHILQNPFMFVGENTDLFDVLFSIKYKLKNEQIKYS